MEARKNAALARKAAAAAKKAAKKRKPAGPFSSYLEVVSDPDLIAFLKRYGYTEKREQPTYKLCRALFDSAPPKDKDEVDEFMPFKKGDEMVVGYYSASRGWSVVLPVKRAFDYEAQKRKWSLVIEKRKREKVNLLNYFYSKVPNVYIEVVDVWQKSEME